jgi:GntR family transcriptional regulator / MocR family aminotransferase
MGSPAAGRSFALDRRRPLGRQIENHLRDGIARGLLRPGSRLPSTRALAADLGVSRGVVVSAYAQLQSEGYLVVRHGAVPRVAEHPPVEPQPTIGLDVQVGSARFNLRPDLPDLGLFPRAQWLAALRAALDRATNVDLAYGEPFGAARLREQLAPFLWRMRGVAASPERIGVHVGSTQALSVIAAVLHSRGARRLGVEDPSHRWRRHALAASGLEIVPIAVDEDGLRVDLLERANVDAVVVSPDHSFPLGVSLSDERRKALLRWAVKNGTLVIEHDYDGYFSHDGKRRPVLQGHAPDHVAYVGSASALLAPTVRIGWSVLPSSLVVAVAGRMAQNIVAHSRIEQLALGELIARGQLDRHIRKARAAYKVRWRAATELLPSCSAPVGLYLTVPLPSDADESSVLSDLRAQGVALDGVNANAIHERAPGLVIGFAASPEPTLREALEVVRTVAGLDDAELSCDLWTS